MILTAERLLCTGAAICLTAVFLSAPLAFEVLKWAEATNLP